MWKDRWTLFLQTIRFHRWPVSTHGETECLAVELGLIVTCLSDVSQNTGNVASTHYNTVASGTQHTEKQDLWTLRLPLVRSHIHSVLSTSREATKSRSVVQRLYWSQLSGVRDLFGGLLLWVEPKSSLVPRTHSATEQNPWLQFSEVRCCTHLP